MLKIKVNATESFSLPEDPEETKLQNFIDFDLKYSELLKWMGEVGPHKLMYKKNQIKYIAKLADNIAVFAGVTKEKMFGLEVGDLKEHLDSLNKKGKLDIKGTKDSIVKLHLHLIKVIIGYVPQIHLDRYEFEHKGETWYLPNFSRGFTAKSIVNPKIKFGHTIAAMENDRVQAEKIAEKGYGDGSSEYTRIVKCVAIFARKKKDKRLKSIQQLNSKINERMLYFQDVNMKVGLDCCFFLSDFTEN